MVRSRRNAVRFVVASAALFAAGGAGTGDSPVRELGEVYHSPYRGEAWHAVRDDETGRKWFESERGERMDSIDDIVRREEQALPEIERVVESSLAHAAADPSREGETVDVTFLLRRQPAHDAGMDARAKYAPLFAAPLSRSRAIVAALDLRRPLPGRADPSEDERLLTAGEKAQILAARDEIHALSRQMRREVADRAKAEAASDQANLAAWLGRQPNVRVFGSSWILSSVSARVPLGLVLQIAAGFPEIGRIDRISVATASLNASVGAVGASSWWNGGYTGSSGTPVAILDTGIDSTHPALTVSQAAHFLSAASSQSFFNDNSSSSDDFVTHGTHVAGIVASNDTTYRGVAPGAALMNAKCGFLTTFGGGSFMGPDIYAAGDWAADNGAAVMNCSFGANVTPNGQSDDAKFFDAAVFDLSVAVAIASGNAGSGSGTVGSPGDAFNIVTAGNFDDAGTTSRSDDSLASSSSRGPTSDGRRKPDVSAPGTNITSCYAAWEGANADFISYTGTSMASPHVAGAMALLLDYGASWSPEALKALLLSTATNTSPSPASPDNNWGWGGMDLANAYTCRASVAEGTLSSSGDRFALVRLGSIAANGRVTLAWNRHVASNNASVPTSVSSPIDLDLYVYDGSSGTLLGQATGAVNPVEQVKLASAVTNPVAKVFRQGNFPSGFSTEYFAVAAESTGSASVISLPALTCSFVTGAPADAGASQTFTVTVSVRNTGGMTAPGAQATLAVPSGYSVVDGATKTVGDLAVNASGNVTFDVATSTGPSGTKTITASASCSVFGESVASPTVSNSHTLDADAPTGTIVVAGGATYAPSASVTLALTASDVGTGLDAMRLRNVGGEWTAWQSIASSVAWTLPGEGAQTVEAQFRDRVDNKTTVSDGITLDTIAPTGGLRFDDGSAFTLATTVTLTTSATDAVSGVVDQRISSDGSTFGSWEPYGTSHSVSLGTAEAITSRWVEFRDAAGNVSGSFQGSVGRDVTAPTGSIVVNGGAAVTNDRFVTLEMAASDAVAGVSEMRISTNAVTWTPWLGYATQVGYYLPTPDALNTVYVQFRDRAGNVSVTCSDAIFVDATGPEGSIAIEGGAEFTAASTVTISVSATDASSGVAAMRLRNAGGAWSPWQAYATSVSWVLPSGEGFKLVEAQFRDGSGNVAGATDTIQRDLTPPVGTVTVSGGAPAVNHADVTLTLSATDAASGVTEVRTRNDGGEWSAWQPFSANVDFALAPVEGVRSVWTQFRDAVGNESVAVSDDILLDTTSPTGSVSLNGGAALLLPWQTLDAEPVAVDGAGGSGVATMEFSGDGGSTWSDPAAFAGEVEVARPSGVSDAVGQVLARFRDVAGNVSDAYGAATYVVEGPTQGLDHAKSLQGSIAAGGDIDAYSVELLAGDVLTVKAVTRAAARRAAFGVDLDVYDPSHTAIVTGRWPADAKRQGIAKLVAPSTGTYVVLVRGTGDASGGTYSLSAKVARKKSSARPRGTAEPVESGASWSSSVEFDATTDGTVSGSVRLIVNTAFRLVAPDGSGMELVARSRGGVAHLDHLPLTGGTGRYVLRFATPAPVRYALSLASAPRVGRLVENAAPVR